MADHERIRRQAQVDTLGKRALSLQLAIEESDGIPHESGTAPLGEVAHAAVVPGHQEGIARVPAAVAAAQDVVDAVEPEAAPVEQALPLNGLDSYLKCIRHGTYSAL
jgi:hypothetical protein